MWSGNIVRFAVFRIRDILVRIQIRGSIHLTNGSGSGSCFFVNDLIIRVRYCITVHRIENKLFYFSLFIYLLCGEGLFAVPNRVYLCENIFLADFRSCFEQHEQRQSEWATWPLRRRRVSSVVSTSSSLTRRRRRFWPSLPPTTGEHSVLDPNIGTCFQLISIRERGKQAFKNRWAPVRGQLSWGGGGDYNF